MRLPLCFRWTHPSVLQIHLFPWRFYHSLVLKPFMSTSAWFHCMVLLTWISFLFFVMMHYCRWRQQPGNIPHARHGLWLHASGSCWRGGAMAGRSWERRTGWQRRAEERGGRVAAHSPAGKRRAVWAITLCAVISSTCGLFHYSFLVLFQKALLHKQQSQPLLELPMGYKEKEMTAEMMQKREERARKRRLQAAKKAEENKNQTIERLTKTSKAKIKSMKERKSKQTQCPMIRYSDSVLGMAVSFPTGVPTPLPAPPRPPPVAPVACGVAGCTNLKKYSCSKTGVPLCSLDCYKRNLLLVQSAAWTATPRVCEKWLRKSK